MDQLEAFLETPNGPLYLGIILGLCCFSGKIWELWKPSGRSRRQERILIPAVIIILFFTTVLFFRVADHNSDPKKGFQALVFGLLFFGLLIGILPWMVIVLLQWSQPLPPDMPRETEPLQSAGISVIKNTYAIDGNNVAMVNEALFDLRIVRALAKHFRQDGSRVRVFFDANVGMKYTSNKRHLDLSEVSKLIDISEDSISIVPGGTTADEWIIKWAIAQKATVITLDRYRDHLKNYPEFDPDLQRLTFMLIGDELWLKNSKTPIRLE